MAVIQSLLLTSASAARQDKLDLPKDVADILKAPILDRKLVAVTVLDNMKKQSEGVQEMESSIEDLKYDLLSKSYDLRTITRSNLLLRGLIGMGCLLGKVHLVGARFFGTHHSPFYYDRSFHTTD
jgi:hypothetical protein